jgi:putative DNA primase/helicase
MTTFTNFLSSLGLVPRAVSPDGKWRRCPTREHPKKRNGSYKLDPGGTIGWAQDWATMESPATWRADGESTAPARVDQAAMREAHRKAMAEQAAAIRRAVEFYRDCSALRDGHPYMERQGLSMAGAFGVRVDRDGWLVVPGYRDGQMVTYQRISPEGEKRFATGAPVQGSCHTIERRGATMTVVVEGWADAVSIAFHIYRGNAVGICAFGKERMEKVAQAVADHYQPERITLLEDAT